MSQKLIYSLLQDLGGEATTGDIKEAAKKRFPDRSLDEYTYNRLQSLKKRGVISQNECDNSNVWVIEDEDYRKSPVKINEIDREINRGELLEFGIEVSNIVVTFDLNTKIDLYKINEVLSNTIFEPETMTPLVFKKNTDANVTFLLYSSGKVVALGLDNKNSILSELNRLIEEIEAADYTSKAAVEDALVRNILAGGDLNSEIDLEQLSIYLGLENIEYNPKKFPALVYRLKRNTVMLYRTGKFNIVGAESYLDLLETRNELFENLPSEIIDSMCFSQID